MSTAYTEQQLIKDIRSVFQNSLDPREQAHSIAQIIERGFDSGWPLNSAKFGKENGTYEIYKDKELGHPSAGFMILAYRQPASKKTTPSPHDHGLCFVVYGVQKGSNIQTRYTYSYSDDRSEMPSLRPTQIIEQLPGHAHYFLPGEIHSTQGSTEIETIYVRITSMDLTNITRHRYDVKSGRSRSFSAHDARTTRK